MEKTFDAEEAHVTIPPPRPATHFFPPQGGERITEQDLRGGGRGRGEEGQRKGRGREEEGERKGRGRGEEGERRRNRIQNTME